MTPIQRQSAARGAALRSIGPLPLQRCEPTRACGQVGSCARAKAPVCDSRPAIDASVSVVRSVGWCPMFIDSRGVSLIDPRLKHMEMLP